MISSPLVHVQCDQSFERSLCRNYTAFSLPSFTTDRSAAVMLFRNTHPQWHVTAEGKVYCPQCRVIAQNSALAAKVAEEPRP